MWKEVKMTSGSQARYENGGGLSVLILEQAPRVSSDRYLAFPNDFWKVHGSSRTSKKLKIYPDAYLMGHRMKLGELCQQ